MVRICSHCQKILGEKPPYDDKRLTHGICSPCMKELYGLEPSSASVDRHSHRHGGLYRSNKTAGLD